MKTNQINHKVFDQSEAIEKAKKLITKVKKQQINMKYIRIDTDTIIGVKSTRKNIDQIIDKLKSNKKKTSIIDQIEYGHYA